MQQHKPAKAITANKKTTRHLKVRSAHYAYQLYQNPYQRTPVGEIHLKGHWLVQAGFEIDSPVTITISEGCLIVTAK